MIGRLKAWAKAANRDVLALCLAMRDPRVSVWVKLLAAVVAGYALSPIDLIPDFIPVIGYLDDLLLVPLGIVLVVRLIPKPVMEDLRRKAAGQLSGNRREGKVAARVIVVAWIALALGIAWMIVENVLAS